MPASRCTSAQTAPLLGALSRRGLAARGRRRRQPEAGVSTASSRAVSEERMILKSPEEIEIMRAANVIVAEVLAELRGRVARA